MKDCKIRGTEGGRQKIGEREEKRKRRSRGKEERGEEGRKGIEMVNL